MDGDHPLTNVMASREFIYDAELSRVQASIDRSQACEDAYRQLQKDRLLIGVGRISMGMSLHILLDNEGWKGRTGAKSFRRFLLEEGIEPRAAYQYMQVARAYIVEHDVDPRRIALVSMRLLIQAIKFLTPDTLEDVIAVLTSMPTVEAKHSLENGFDEVMSEALSSDRPALSKSVARALGVLDELTLDERSDFYRVLRLRSDAPAATGPGAEGFRPAHSAH